MPRQKRLLMRPVIAALDVLRAVHALFAPTAVDFAPDALARTLGLPAPAVREPVDQLQPAAVGGLLVGAALTRCAGADIRDLDPEGAQLGPLVPGRPRGAATSVTTGAGLRGKAHAQHGGAAGMHHGVGDEFGDEQDQSFGERLVGP